MKLCSSVQTIPPGQSWRFMKWKGSAFGGAFETGALPSQAALPSTSKTDMKRLRCRKTWGFWDGGTSQKRGKRPPFVSFLHQPSLRFARGPRPVKALVTDALPSIGRSSEYPSDDLLGIGLKAAAMAEHNALRPP